MVTCETCGRSFQTKGALTLHHFRVHTSKGRMQHIRANAAKRVKEARNKSDLAVIAKEYVWATGAEAKPIKNLVEWYERRPR